MKRLLILVPSLGAGIWIGILSARLFLTWPFGPILNAILLIAVLIISYCLQVIVHEAGHILFGKLAGFSFQSFRLLDFLWVKENGKIHLYRQHIPGTLGQALMIPPDHLGRGQAILYNLGGILANLILSLIALVLGFYVSDSEALVLQIFAVLGILIAWLNGFPHSNGLVNNDGANVVLLAKRDKTVQAFRKQLKINSLNAQNIRLKDMDDALFEIQDAQNPLERTIEVFTINRMIDQHDFSSAYSSIEKLLEHSEELPGIYVGQLKLEHNFVDLLNGKSVNRPHGEELILLNGMKENPSSIRYWYAWYLLGKNNEKRAESFKKQFEKIQDKVPYQADYQSEKELIELVDKTFKDRKIAGDNRAENESVQEKN